MINPTNVIRILIQKYPVSSYPSTSSTSEEEDLAHQLVQVIEGCRSSSLLIETLVDLDFDDNWYSDADDDDNDDDPDYLKSPQKSDGPTKTALEGALRLLKNNPRTSLATIKSKYPSIKYMYQVNRYMKQKESGGSRNAKIAKIRNECLEIFKEAKENHLIVHDDDVQRWALLVNHSFPEPLPHHLFSGSAKFVTRWKKQNRVVSRKITKIVSIFQR